MLLTVPGNEGHRGAVVQQSNRGLHLLSGQVQLTGNLGNLDVNHGRQFCILSARIVSCCLIEESHPNFSTWGLLSRVNCICRFALTRALHGVAAWDHLWYSVNVGKAGVKAVEFGSGVVGAEPAVDGDVRCVALALVGGDLALQCVRVGISPLEAGAAQRAEFDLCHVEPTGVFGRVVKLEPLHDAPRIGGRKGLVMGDSGRGWRRAWSRSTGRPGCGSGCR